MQQNQGLLSIAQAQRKQLQADNEELSAKVTSLSQSRHVLEAPLRMELKELQDRYDQLQRDKVRYVCDGEVLTRADIGRKGAKRTARATGSSWPSKRGDARVHHHTRNAADREGSRIAWYATEEVLLHSLLILFSGGERVEVAGGVTGTCTAGYRGS